MYRSLIPILLCLFCIEVAGQINISGTVLSGEDNEPLIGAQVILENGQGTVTDKDGYFTLSLTPGNHQASIRYLGYETLFLDIQTDKPDLGVLAMQLSSTTLQEVIVSASPNNYKGNFKGSNYRINPATLNAVNPLNTEEVLRTIPGVNIVGDMGLSNRPNISIRGSWGRRSQKVLLMEDGSPSAPAPYVAPGAYYNPVSDRITSIEIYKGADMLRFGPNNMYGAVNYITALPPQKPELRLKLIGGQRNYATGLLSYGGTWNNLGALVEGVYKSFDGFMDNSSVELLNLNAKIFAKLSEDQSLYFKVSGQFEDNQASLSAQTPFTFALDPTQNPLDADQFTMRRYGVDIIHKWLPAPSLSLTSKIYASDFERDWWRQVTAKVLASEVRNIVGDDIFNDRYTYLNNAQFGEEDYVIIGRVNNGRESTTDSRWTFTVSGLQETLDWEWEAFGETQNLEVGLKFHQENYKDQSLSADSSRWARHGRTTLDLRYYLFATSGYIRNAFHAGKWGITPILRIEYVDMYRHDLIAASQNPQLPDIRAGRETNIYTVAMPGITLDYRIPNGEIFGSLYQGFIAPSKIFGFLVEQDGVVTNPHAGQSINIDPELSINTEVGWRGNLLDNRVNGQLTYFHNTVRNFYAGGRNEVFEKLGRIRIQGLEMAIGAEIYKHPDHELRFFGNATLLDSKILSGKLVDHDLFSQVIHNTATRNEFIEKVNRHRDAYTIYVKDINGDDVLLTDAALTEEQFANISKVIIGFGDDGIDNARAPYTPSLNLTAGLDFHWKDLAVGVSGQYCGKQYTEFHNFVNESADGAIGQLPAFFTMDAFANYTFMAGDKMQMQIFVNGKNITNDIYRASRLNRANSGIFPGGFREIIAGIHLRI